MQLGFVTAIFPDLNLDQILQFAAEENYDCVEAMCWPLGKKDRKYGGVTHVDLDDFGQGQADEVLGLCEKHGVGLSALGYYPNPLSHDEQVSQVARDHLHKVIDAAPKLGLSVINTFVGADHTLNLDANFDRFSRVWPDIIRFAEDRGVRVAIENCQMLFADTWPFGNNLAQSPYAWRRMFETIESDHFGLNMDPSHLVMTHIDPILAIHEFGHKIFHAHAKDMKLDPQKLYEFGSLQCAHITDWGIAKLPGLGDVDWNRWVSALTDVGYDGPVCVEVEDDAFTLSLKDRKRSLRLSRNVLRGLMV